jgi:hypothetical protein
MDNHISEAIASASLVPHNNSSNKDVDIDNHILGGKSIEKVGTPFPWILATG